MQKLTCVNIASNKEISVVMDSKILRMKEFLLNYWLLTSVESL